MGRRPDPSLLRPVCPNKQHAGSKVIGKETRSSSDGVVRRRYECQPVGHKRHKFTVVVSAPQDGITEAVVATSPPSCLEHPDSRVIRNGMYPSRAAAGSTGVKRRQRYRCFPDDGSPAHDFCPPLPRLAVNFGHEHCPSCEELTGVHHGAKSSARGHSSLLHIVVDALEAVAGGTSYTEASATARRKMGPYKPRPAPSTTPRPTRVYHKPTKPNGRVSASARQARAHWRLAADWTEIYAPVLFKHINTQMRQAEAQMMRDPDPARPSVLILDAVPAHSKRGKKVSRRRWVVLSAASVVWDPTNPAIKSTRLRLLRAYPVENSLTWRLFLDELAPFTPEFVVADLGKAQVNAVRQTWTNAIIIPSLYHLLTNVERDLKKVPGSQVRNIHGVYEYTPALHRHLYSLTGDNLVTWNQSDWDQWWDDLCAIVTSLGGTVASLRKRQKRLAADISVVLPKLNAYKTLPLSTGGLEMLLDSKIKPLLERRQHGFANIERLNHLLDLVVCKDRQLFDDRHHVAHLIQTDNEASAGWSRRPRTVDDKMTVDPATGLLQPVSSLSDYTVVTAMAHKRGLI